MFNNTRKTRRGRAQEKQEGPLFGGFVGENARNFVQTCVDFIERKEVYLKEAGLYRVSGGHLEIQQLRADAIKDGKDFRLAQHDNAQLHNVTGLLKLFLRELQEPVVPFDLYFAYVAAASCTQADGRRQLLMKVMAVLPGHSFLLLQLLLTHLKKVASHSATNLMGAANLAVVFAPTIFRSAVNEAPEVVLTDSAVLKTLTAELIDGCEYFFSVLPAELEAELGPLPPEDAELLEKLCSAAWNGELAIVKEILESGKPLINRPNKRGQSPLYCASRQGHPAVIVALLNHPKVNVNLKVVEHGGTPLHAAGFGMHAECVALLLSFGAAQIENKNGLVARQEARGSACDVYATFERGGVDALVAAFPTHIPQLNNLKAKYATPVAGESPKVPALNSLPQATGAAVLPISPASDSRSQAAGLGSPTATSRSLSFSHHNPLFGSPLNQNHPLLQPSQPVTQANPGLHQTHQLYQPPQQPQPTAFQTFPPDHEPGHHPLVRKTNTLNATASHPFMQPLSHNNNSSRQSPFNFSPPPEENMSPRFASPVHAVYDPSFRQLSSSEPPKAPVKIPESPEPSRPTSSYDDKISRRNSSKKKVKSPSRTRIHESGDPPTRPKAAPVPELGPKKPIMPPVPSRPSANPIVFPTPAVPANNVRRLGQPPSNPNHGIIDVTFGNDDASAPELRNDHEQMEATIAAQMKALDDEIQHLENSKQQMLEEKKHMEFQFSPRDRGSGLGPRRQAHVQEDDGHFYVSPSGQVRPKRAKQTLKSTGGSALFDDPTFEDPTLKALSQDYGAYRSKSIYNFDRMRQSFVGSDEDFKLKLEQLVQAVQAGFEIDFDSLAQDPS